MKKKANDINYQDGYAFYNDLITTYGVTEGRAKAQRYLDLPLPSKLDDVEAEKEFRDELVKAMEEGRR